MHKILHNCFWVLHKMLYYNGRPPCPIEGSCSIGILSSTRYYISLANESYINISNIGIIYRFNQSASIYFCLWHCLGRTIPIFLQKDMLVAFFYGNFETNIEQTWVEYIFVLKNTFISLSLLCSHFCLNENHVFFCALLIVLWIPNKHSSIPCLHKHQLFSPMIEVECKNMALRVINNI